MLYMPEVFLVLKGVLAVWKRGTFLVVCVFKNKDGTWYGAHVVWRNWKLSTRILSLPPWKQETQRLLNVPCFFYCCWTPIMWRPGPIKPLGLFIMHRFCDCAMDSGILLQILLNIDIYIYIYTRRSVIPKKSIIFVSCVFTVIEIVMP